MRVDVTTEIVIERPPEVVSAFAADPDNAPKWYVNIESVEWKTPRPFRVGSLVAFVARFLGRRMAYTYEIVAFVPSEQLVMRTAQGPFPMETHYHWDSAARASTRMALRNVGEPSGFSKLLAPFMAMAMRRANTKDLESLKQILESAVP
ncbi:MAG: SRPBCC family protein [Acidobacteriota bacterium]